ncbi:hypothetical protein PACTADRAFT_50929 [Pachysolen tannophilus NRRL Y-2460]|uniref:NADH:flavin oxidoreductase/NADH oxidase N-terminal domain-containing protein n=1 Tax=Pachysolen tannophilus NRRL Y-2460 TaxID=669874 RepID=A0A1E4TQL6_PACTA|nr:hypothetical protein PACTADRAFT_50929 [Pachysolen tannophilus NRRL Y-2460]
MATHMNDTSTMFESFKLGSSTLSHRVALAPCTRMRAEKAGDFYVPGDLMVEYYTQRATAGGLLITDACPISETACGYLGVAGIFNSEQVSGWKRVTDAVHSKGGIIYCQLWHVGRATVAQLIKGTQPISSVSTALEGDSLFPGVSYRDAPPRAMIKDDFIEVTNDFVKAAKVAIEKAGFDGVEIHGANGYLLDQFLHDNVNTRTDTYGGKSIKNRARFPLEVLKSVCTEIGAEKTAIRLSPFNYFQDTRDSDPNATWSYVCQEIVNLDEPIAYVHMIEPRFDEKLNAEDKIKSLEEQVGKAEGFSLNGFRSILKNKNISFIAAGGFSKETALKKLEAGDADVIAFGRHFIANPDLVERFKADLPLNKYDRPSFYGSDPPKNGYTTYPTYANSQLNGKAH